VTSRNRSTSNDSKGNTNGKSPANLEQTAEDCDANILCNRIGCSERELDQKFQLHLLPRQSKERTYASNAGNPREDVEEDSRGLAYHLP
jgi:hypothetical protein